MQNNRKVGKKDEQIAGEYLKRQGYEIIRNNYFCKAGEIDLIAREGGYLVFVEVKYRKNKSAGWGMEAVDKNKQRRISRCAIFYLMEHSLSFEQPIRFDVISIDCDQITLIKNAFFYQP